jgi:heme-degrading monooxygenase HmoA
MIRHIVFFTCIEANKVAVFQELKTLETIQGNWTLQVTENLKIDQFANDIDFVVYGEFPDEQAIKKFKSSPIYNEATKNVRPLRDLRFAADVQA